MISFGLLEVLKITSLSIEPQSVSGKWRALSRSHLKAIVANEGGHSSMRLQLAETLAQHVTAIIIASGVSGPPHLLTDEIWKVGQRSFEDITRLGLEFQSITGERIVSRDLLAIVPNPGARFDPTSMTDEGADPRRRGRQVVHHHVLCTTQLGLTREENGEQSVVLLKPSVYLTNMLEDLEGPR